MSLKIRLLALFLLLFVIAYTQEAQQLVIVGSVFSEQNNDAVTNAYVQDLLTSKTTISNINGVFVLKTRAQANVITISHVSYYSKRYRIDENVLRQAKNDTLFLEIYLNPKVEELQEVEVNTDIVEIVHKRQASTLDYEFFGDKLLLLIKDKSHYALQLVNAQDSILSEKTLSIMPENLTKDCTGNIHLKSKDSVYQLVVDEKFKLSFLGFTQETYKKVLAPCVAITKEKAFFKQIASFNNKGIRYFTVDKATQEKETLLHVYDKVAERVAQSHYNSVITTYYSVTPEYNNIIELGLWNGDLIELTHSNPNTLIPLVAFYLKIASTPIYVPMKYVRDSVYVFNYFEESLLVYNNNAKFIRGLNLNHHHERALAKDIVVDYKKENVYVKFIRNGLVYLKQVDLNTGKLTEDTIRLEQNTFPENIGIRGNYVYYLHKDKNETYNHLYRQKM